MQKRDTARVYDLNCRQNRARPRGTVQLNLRDPLPGWVSITAFALAAEATGPENRGRKTGWLSSVAENQPTRPLREILRQPSSESIAGGTHTLPQRKRSAPRIGLKRLGIIKTAALRIATLAWLAVVSDTSVAREFVLVARHVPGSSRRKEMRCAVLCWHRSRSLLS
jgi:hypothetical protein